MKPENRQFLEENRHHWITLRDAFYMRHLDGNTRENMRRVMSEEFVPGYSADLWCPPCVSEMVTSLYRYFENWERAQVTEEATAEPPDNAAADPPANTVNPESGPAADPIQVKANFPSHKNKGGRR